jgi:hypothetical protein
MRAAKGQRRQGHAPQDALLRTTKAREQPAKERAAEHALLCHADGKAQHQGTEAPQEPALVDHLARHHIVIQVPHHEIALSTMIHHMNFQLSMMASRSKRR